MGVDLGRTQARVTQQLLDDAEVRATVQQVGGITVAESVGMSRYGRTPIEHAAYVARRHVTAAPIDEQELVGLAASSMAGRPALR